MTTTLAACLPPVGACLDSNPSNLTAYRQYQHILEQFSSKTSDIDSMMKEAMMKSNTKINEQYSNIKNTVKLIKTLIAEFTKKTEETEQSLRNSTRLNDLGQQISYHKVRKGECSKMTIDLQSKINHVKKELDGLDEEAIDLRRQVIQAKLNNLKTIMRIDMAEKQQTEAKRREELNQSKTEAKLKLNFKRSLIAFKPTQSNFISNLIKEKELLTTELLRTIHSEVAGSQILNSCYDAYRSQLTSKQRKCNNNGLSGSLLFRIMQNQMNQQPAPKPKRQIDPRNHVYQVLKNKYEAMKAKEREQNGPDMHITMEQFMTFSPMQIMGLLELKKGLKGMLVLQSNEDKYKPLK